MNFSEHGGNIDNYIEKYGKEPIDFSANINPFGLPEGVRTVLKNSVDAFVAYPDTACRHLRKVLSEKEKVDESFFVFGNGAADLIYRIVNSFKPKKALLLAPTFSEYESALKKVNANVTYYLLNPDAGFRIGEDFLDYIVGKDMVFICNPNNPTGMATHHKSMKKIIDTCKKEMCTVVVDECFNGFIDDSDTYSCKGYLQQYDNLILLKAFTKIYAMAGLRLGYLMCCHKKINQRIQEQGQPWNVSVPAQIAGVEALKDRAYLEKTRQHIRQQRQWLTEKLEKNGMIVFQSYGNYILFQDKDAGDLYQKMMDYGILIRRCENYIGLDSTYYRIAVKCQKDNEKLIESLIKIRR